MPNSLTDVYKRQEYANGFDTSPYLIPLDRNKGFGNSMTTVSYTHLAPMALASSSISTRYSITRCLCGTVTLRPSRFRA